MVAIAVVRERLSLEDFLAMPETKPASEYIDGKIVQKPFAGGKHSLLKGALTSAISQQAEGKKIALALMELRCTFGGRSLVPDIAVIRWDNLPRDEDGEIGDRFEHCPDWVIEILSPDQSAMTVIEKIIFCMEQGTELGWLIDPLAKSILVFQQSGLPKNYSHDKNPAESLIVMAGFQDWQLSTEDIFNWLRV